MKAVLQDNRRFLLRFDKGDDVMAGISDFMAKQNFQAATFSGIGSCSEVELGYYNIHLKEYRKKPYFEDLEIVSFNGNGAIFEGKPVLHGHGMFGRTDFTVFGGHVFKMVANATCEVFLIHLDGKMERKKNEEFNLNLLE